MKIILAVSIFICTGALAQTERFILGPPPRDTIRNLEYVTYRNDFGRQITTKHIPTITRRGNRYYTLDGSDLRLIAFKSKDSIYPTINPAQK
jgi:hypothetical protein